MAYVSLYRKYRPQTFAEVVGQQHVTRSLVNAIREDRLHHAYLFAGPRGTGKTSTARILAKSINCVEGPTPEPCNACAQCVAITDGSAVDVIELDMASHGGVDDARELRDRAQFAPAAARRKVYILDEVHMASTAAFNALLKLVEEPPAHVLFAMATTDPQKVLPTILSRVQRLDLRRVGAADVAGRVRDLVAREGGSIDDAAVDLVVRAGDGSVRDTESVLEQVLSYADGQVTGADVAEVLGQTTFEHTAAAVDAAVGGDLAGAFARVQDLLDEGTDLRQFTLDLVAHVRDLLVLVVAPDRPDLVDATPDRLDALVAQSHGLDRDALAGALDDLAVALEQMRQGPARLALELALARIATRPGAPRVAPASTAPPASAGDAPPHDDTNDEPTNDEAGDDDSGDDDSGDDVTGREPPPDGGADTGEPGASVPADESADEPAGGRADQPVGASSGTAAGDRDAAVDEDTVATVPGDDAEDPSDGPGAGVDEANGEDEVDREDEEDGEDEAARDDEPEIHADGPADVPLDQALEDAPGGGDGDAAGGDGDEPDPARGDFATRAGQRAERIARDGLPEVPADRPAGPEVEVAEPPSRDETLELERIRARWEAILELVRADSKRSHAIFEPAQVLGLRNGVLALGYGERYRSFHATNAVRGEFSQVLQEAVEQATGVRVVLDVRVDGEGPRRPRPKPMDDSPGASAASSGGPVGAARPAGPAASPEPEVPASATPTPLGDLDPAEAMDRAAAALVDRLGASELDDDTP